EVLSPKIVGYKQIGPAVAIVITPSTGKTVAAIVLVESRLFGNVLESAISPITVHDVRWAVVRVVIRPRDLRGSHGPAIGADIQVEESVVVKVSQRRGGHSASLGCAARKGLRRNLKVAVPIVQE